MVGEFECGGCDEFREKMERFLRIEMASASECCFKVRHRLFGVRFTDIFFFFFHCDHDQTSRVSKKIRGFLVINQEREKEGDHTKREPFGEGLIGG